jgi:hypothetical protein
VAESEGVVTVSCASSTWANELDFLASELASRLNAAMDGSETQAGVIQKLRMVVQSSRV